MPKQARERRPFRRLDRTGWWVDMRCPVDGHLIRRRGGDSYAAALSYQRREQEKLDAAARHIREGAA